MQLRHRTTRRVHKIASVEEVNDDSFYTSSRVNLVSKQSERKGSLNIALIDLGSSDRNMREIVGGMTQHARDTRHSNQH